MQIRLGKKKLVMFLANADDVLEDDIINLLKEKNLNWTKKDLQEAADLLEQFGLKVMELFIRSVRDEIKTTESQQRFQHEFDQWKTKLEAFAKRKGITLK